MQFSRALIAPGKTSAAAAKRLLKYLYPRVMCTGYVSKGSVDAWSASNLAGYDIDNCEYYLIKKLPIVAYATVQMQSNAIQVASGASPASPTSPTTPVSTTPPTPSSPTTPLQPFPEPPATVVTPAPVAPIATTPSQPADPIPTDPNTPVACTAPLASPTSPAVMTGAITPQQAQQQQQANQKMIAMAGPALPLVCVINPGVCVATAAGIIRVCTTAVSVIRQLIVAGVAYETYNCAVNGTCAVAAPTADSLTAGHNAANGDRTKPGYGGQCTPDNFDALQGNKNSSCSGARGCNSQDSPESRLAKITKLKQCIAAREAVMNSCFAGGDDIHKNEVAIKKNDLARCEAMK